MSRGTQQLSWPAQSVEWGAVGFGKIIEEQLQLEGMGRGLSENTETHSIEVVVRAQSMNWYNL